MKTYSKPNTQKVEIETTSLIASTTVTFGSGTKNTNEADAQEHTMSNTSVWGDEEE